MKNKCYINGLGCVSGQDTLQEGFLETTIDYSDTALISVVKPTYKDFIPPAAIRRMSGGVKNSIVASSVAMKDAGVTELGAIITGTGMGCIQDSEKFLSKLLEFNEEYLTPTQFIQSTHNTVAGQIALNLQSKSYNFTYVHVGNSFQSALLDGMLQVQVDGNSNVLIGGVDEIGERSVTLFRLIDIYKNEGETTYSPFLSTTKGGIASEAATFLVLDKTPTENSYAEVVDVTLKHQVSKEELNHFVEDFLQTNGLTKEVIDVVILGKSGDISWDFYYDEMQQILPEADAIYYKHLFGESHTMPAVATWVGAKILKTQTIPTVLYGPENQSKKKTFQNVLIYNHFRGKEHSLILLKNV